MAQSARVPPSRSTECAAPPAASAEQALQFAETLARSCSRALGETVAGVILRLNITVPYSSTGSSVSEAMLSTGRARQIRPGRQGAPPR